MERNNCQESFRVVVIVDDASPLYFHLPQVPVLSKLGLGTKLAAANAVELQKLRQNSSRSVCLACFNLFTSYRKNEAENVI